MTFDDTNEEYSDSPDQPTDARICPWCKTRELGKRKDAATCGDRACKKAYMKAYLKEYAKRPYVRKKEQERVQSDEFKEAARQRANDWYNAKKDDPDFKAKERARGKMRRQNPDHVAYHQSYQQRPEVKDYHREYNNRPEVKERKKELLDRPGVREKLRQDARQRYADPVYRAEVRAKQNAKNQTPEAKAWNVERAKDWLNRPGNRDKRRTYRRAYYHRPEIKAKQREKHQLRGRPYPRGWGGPKRRWEMQRRQDAYGVSIWDGRSYRSISKHFETDHLVPLSLLEKIGITEKPIIHAIPNIWLTEREKNRGESVGKHAIPFHKWLESIGAPKPVIKCGQEWYEYTVDILVKMKQELDPSYELTDERRAILGLD